MLISSHVVACTLWCWLVISNRQNSRIQSTNDNCITWYLLFKQWSLEWWINGVHYNESISFSFPLQISPGNMLSPFKNGFWEPAEIHLQTHNSAESLWLPSCGFHAPSGVSKTHWCFRLGRSLRDHLYLFLLRRRLRLRAVKRIAQGHTERQRWSQGLRVGLSEK